MSDNNLKLRIRKSGSAFILYRKTTRQGVMLTLEELDALRQTDFRYLTFTRDYDVTANKLSPDLQLAFRFDSAGRIDFS